MGLIAGDDKKKSGDSPKKSSFLKNLNSPPSFAEGWFKLPRLKKLVTQVGAPRCLDIVQAQLAGFRLAICWLAHSKQGIGLSGSSEGMGCLALRVGDTASGWLHRAAITSHSLQWKDNGPVLPDP
ncbi:unnamed protein product [Fraxinus pennsylvanica]|uniref:Uncharacterized protein n=1 Tax=Fraxinus pennsylvanica TaxID=56036 RepID=A0AAD2AA11_9LAMI|nr:unnamed protein product [Fraxinus pennsylvanica]